MRSEDDIQLAYLWNCYRAVGFSATPAGQAYKAAWLRLVRDRDRRLGFGSWKSTEPAGPVERSRHRPSTKPSSPLRATLGELLLAKRGQR